MEIVAEEWREVAGEFAGLPYEVSSIGRVRRQSSGRVLKQGPNRGYSQTTISNRGVGRKVKVHRLVAMAFVHGYQPDLQVNHKNGIKSDNRRENLEWVTCRENHEHAVFTGLRDRMGVGHFRRKLAADEAETVRKLLARGVSYRFLARWFGVATGSISCIKRGLTYQS